MPSSTPFYFPSVCLPTRTRPRTHDSRTSAAATGGAACCMPCTRFRTAVRVRKGGCAEGRDVPFSLSGSGAFSARWRGTARRRADTDASATQDGGEEIPRGEGIVRESVATRVRLKPGAPWESGGGSALQPRAQARSPLLPVRTGRRGYGRERGCHQPCTAGTACAYASRVCPVLCPASVATGRL
jgi:hypothetical protein